MSSSKPDLPEPTARQVAKLDRIWRKCGSRALERIADEDPILFVEIMLTASGLHDVVAVIHDYRQCRQLN
jgi:hypothetical protein